jgi:hypothetical protein
MSDHLDLGPPPSRSPLPAVLIAVAVLALIAAAVFYFNPHTTADVSVNGTQTYAARNELKADPGAMHVIGTVGSVDYDLYVAVNVSIKDRLRLPLFVKEITATLNRADGTAQEGDMILSSDIPHVIAAFPPVGPMMTNPLPRDRQIAPGETATGTVLIHFSQTKPEDWTARKSAVLTVNYFHQSPQTLTIR